MIDVYLIEPGTGHKLYEKSWQRDVNEPLSIDERQDIAEAVAEDFEPTSGHYLVIVVDNELGELFCDRYRFEEVSEWNVYPDTEFRADEPTPSSVSHE